MTATKSPESSPSPELKGSTDPTKRAFPEFIDSEWETCHKINARGGIEMLEWQDLVMRSWLSRNAGGKWASSTCGISVPRQNGKTIGVVVTRASYGMIRYGEEVIYTSHLQKTSTETFEAIAALFDSKAFRGQVKDIKTALGREQVVLKNGGRIKFLARTRNGGRGQHGDLLIFDEALELDEDSQASFLPAISASRNPQTIYATTPPTPSSPGLVIRGIRDKALSGESDRTAWHEWSIDEIGDISDKSRWYATNPSLGILIQESTVEAELEQMSEDTFARERLGWWSPIAGLKEFAIPASKFESLSVDAPPQGGRDAYGVRFAADGSDVSLCSARLHDGKVFVEQTRREPMAMGLGWLADWITERKSKGCCCVIDGKSGAQALVDKLGRMPANYIVTPSASQVVAACATLVDRVNEGTLEWYAPNRDLFESAVTSTRRRIGSSGGWGFGGENPVPIEAASLAVWGVLNSKRNPERKQRIG